MYAIVEISGFQYRVEPDATIKVPKIEKKVGDEVTITNVMLFSDGQRVKIGRPFLEDAKVKGMIVSHGRGEKLIVFKFKRRKGYKKKTGHRQDFTEIKVSSIEAK